MKNNKEFKKKHGRAESGEPVREQAVPAEETAGGFAAEDNPEEDGKECAGTAAEGVADELQQARERLAQAEDKYLRLAAEFDNYRRRTSREKLDLVKNAAEDVLKGLLPVLDDCERAIAQLEKTEASTFEKEGTALIYNKLKSYVKSCGLEEMSVIGSEFDTDTAEAVAQVPVQDAGSKGMVVDVIQKGYTLNGKVVRFAKVVIGQ